VITERAQAKREGRTRYIPTRPCRRGHTTFRWTASGNCGACLDTPEQKTARNANSRRYYATPTGRAARHGLSLAKYQEILERQQECCAICKRPLLPGRLTTADHDHKHCATARGCDVCVRGLLCPRCNSGIGHLRDDPEMLRRAIKYLEQRL
jgi:hypothetical protein